MELTALLIDSLEVQFCSAYAGVEKIANEVASRIAEELARQKQLRGATI